MSKRITTRIAAAALVAAAFTAGAASASALYTETNDAGGNAIQIFRANADGELTTAGTVSTGGLGTSAGLGNQGALALSPDGRWLFAVNAGSNDISTFAVSTDAPSLVARVSSGGTTPVSLTVHGDVLYVLNAGGSGNIAGFRIGATGRPTAIAGAVRPLSSVSAGAAQIAFDNDGEALVVTEKATNRISVYEVNRGLAHGPRSYPSNGLTPFGFGFDRRNTLLVSEAFGGQPNAAALSSYDLAEEGAGLQLIDGSVPTAQTAACWVILARHGRYAYTTNTGSGSVTGFGIDRSGRLARLSADGRTGVTGRGPTDGTTSPGGSTLFVLSPPIGTVTSFHVAADGSLRYLATATGAAATSTGLVAR